MKILQTPVRFHPYTGGVEKYVLDLSSELVKRGHEVTVLCANEPKSKSDEKIRGINVKRTHYIGKIANTNISLSLPYRILKEDFDIVHTHFPSPWSCDWSMVAAILKNKPMILTYHNDIAGHPTSKFLAGSYSHTFLKLLLKTAKIISITQPDYLEYSNFLKPYTKKIRAIPIGIDLQRFKPLRIKKEKDTLFFLAVLDKFHEYKGLNYLIKAVAIAKKKIRGIKLIIGGRGELVEYYKELARKLGVEDNIKFIGYVGDKQLVGLYNRGSCFVLPSTSHFEGFGIVLLEAMACKTPVICTDIVGVAKDVEKSCAGIVVGPKDVRGLSQAIIKMLNDNKLREKMGSNALQLIRSQYSVGKMAESFEYIYKEAIK